jgi:hypothetical protein
MTQPNRTTFVSFLLDETGSMESIKDDTIAGFNDHLETLQETARAGNEVLFSLVTFNSTHTRKRYVAEPIDSVRKLGASDYNPEAMTPLIDASVKIIKATEEAVARRTDAPAVVVVIQTDGLENVSTEYTNTDLAALVKEKTKAGWQFQFLGAGLDAFAAAHQAGLVLDASHVVAYDRGKSRQVFAAASAHVARYVASHDVGALDFTDEQRDQVGDTSTPRGKRRRKKSTADNVSLS